MNVAGILSEKGSAVATIAPDRSVADAVDQLRRWRVGALVVTSDGRKLEGLVSERDVVRSLAEVGADTLRLTVAELMSVELHTCRRVDRVEGLMSLMTEARVRHLPVVDDDGALVGIVSIGDVVKWRVQQLEQEQAQLIDYVRTGR